MMGKSLQVRDIPKVWARIRLLTSPQPLVWGMHPPGGFTLHIIIWLVIVLALDGTSEVELENFVRFKVFGCQIQSGQLIHSLAQIVHFSIHLWFAVAKLLCPIPKGIVVQAVMHKLCFHRLLMLFCLLFLFPSSNSFVVTPTISLFWKVVAELKRQLKLMVMLISIFVNQVGSFWRLKCVIYGVINWCFFLWQIFTWNTHTHTHTHTNL